MSTTVLATKLFAPGLRERLVARRRLLQELNASLADEKRLTLVSAPPGFGKSTLLSSWLGTFTHQGPAVRAAWLSLDGGDNDLARLLTHLVAALVRSGLDVDSAGLGLDETPEPSVVLTNLLNEVVDAGELSPGMRWLIVLDDYHVIENPAVHEAFDFLLDNLPRQLHLIVATRADPPLRLARLRSRGQLVELRSADLRFTAAEAGEFLESVMGLSLTVEDVEALEERTEGWIAGLQLAALSLRSSSTRDETTSFITAFTGSNRFVIDYLVDEVLARLPPDALNFLLRTSVLERLTGDLCDAVTGESGGAPMLESLERDNVFVVPLDDERLWFRYHHLFADVLQGRLVASDPRVVPALHNRASDWYADHGLVAEAVGHALAARDHGRAARLIEQAVPETRRARQDGALLSWIQALPEPTVRNSPVLSIVSAWSMMVGGDPDAAEARLDDAEAALASGKDDPALAATWADTEDLRSAPAAVHVYRAALAQARGDIDATVECAQHALDLAAPDDHFARGAAGGMLGLATWAAGDVEGAISTFSGAIDSLHAAGNLVDELDSALVLGDMWRTAGQPSRAREVYEGTLATALALGEPYPRATADLHVAIAELDIELNDLVTAAAHLDSAQSLGERSSITENRHRWYLASARLHAARGDHATAVEQLDQAQSLYRAGFYPDIRPISATRARTHIAVGDLDAARAWARREDVSFADELPFLDEYEQLTLVRLHLASHRAHSSSHPLPAAVPLAEIEELLGQLRVAATDPARHGSLLEIGLLHALTLDARGDRDAALVELDRALVRAPEPTSYVRLFIDEGQALLDLLTAAATAVGDGTATARQHAQRLLASAQPTTSVATTSRRPEHSETDSEPLVATLSEREVEVLRLLESDLTGPEIAREMYVTLNTLRTHTKRIFIKLDVKSRSAAVRRGRQLGLL